MHAAPVWFAVMFLHVVLSALLSKCNCYNTVLECMSMYCDMTMHSVYASAFSALLYIQLIRLSRRVIGRHLCGSATCQ